MISASFLGNLAGKAPLAPMTSTNWSRPVVAAAAMAATSNPSFDLSQRRFRSASPNVIQKHRQHPQQQHRAGFFPVYVHHVSKIALEHLQGKRSDWVQSQGLDHGLHINPNGTFVLSFPAKRGFDAGRIWTSYDSSRKQHWLSVYRNKLAVRFLLKDHGQTMSRKIHDSNQTEAQILKAVDQLISAVQQTDAAAAAATAAASQTISSSPL